VERLRFAVGHSHGPDAGGHASKRILFAALKHHQVHDSHVIVVRKPRSVPASKAGEEVAVVHR